MARGSNETCKQVLGVWLKYARETNIREAASIGIVKLSRLDHFLMGTNQ